MKKKFSKSTVKQISIFLSIFIFMFIFMFIFILSLTHVCMAFETFKGRFIVGSKIFYLELHDGHNTIMVNFVNDKTKKLAIKYRNIPVIVEGKSVETTAEPIFKISSIKPDNDGTGLGVSEEITIDGIVEHEIHFTESDINDNSLPNKSVYFIKNKDESYLLDTDDNSYVLTESGELKKGLDQFHLLIGAKVSVQGYKSTYLKTTGESLKIVHPDSVKVLQQNSYLLQTFEGIYHNENIESDSSRDSSINTSPERLWQLPFLSNWLETSLGAFFLTLNKHYKKELEKLKAFNQRKIYVKGIPSTFKYFNKKGELQNKRLGMEIISAVSDELINYKGTLLSAIFIGANLRLISEYMRPNLFLNISDETNKQYALGIPNLRNEEVISLKQRLNIKDITQLNGKKVKVISGKEIYPLYSVESNMPNIFPISLRIWDILPDDSSTYSENTNQNSVDGVLKVELIGNYGYSGSYHYKLESLKENYYLKVNEQIIKNIIDKYSIKNELELDGLKVNIIGYPSIFYRHATCIGSILTIEQIIVKDDDLLLQPERTEGILKMGETLILKTPTDDIQVMIKGPLKDNLDLFEFDDPNITLAANDITFLNGATAIVQGKKIIFANGKQLLIPRKIHVKLLRPENNLSTIEGNFHAKVETNKYGLIKNTRYFLSYGSSTTELLFLNEEHLQKITHSLAIADLLELEGVNISVNGAKSEEKITIHSIRLVDVNSITVNHEDEHSSYLLKGKLKAKFILENNKLNTLFSFEINKHTYKIHFYKEYFNDSKNALFDNSESEVSIKAIKPTTNIDGAKITAIVTSRFDDKICQEITAGGSHLIKTEGILKINPQDEKFNNDSSEKYLIADLVTATNNIFKIIFPKNGSPLYLNLEKLNKLINKNIILKGIRSELISNDITYNSILVDDIIEKKSFISVSGKLKLRYIHDNDNILKNIFVVVVDADNTYKLDFSKSYDLSKKILIKKFNTDSLLDLDDNEFVFEGEFIPQSPTSSFSEINLFSKTLKIFDIYEKPSKNIILKKDKSFKGTFKINYLLNTKALPDSIVVPYISEHPMSEHPMSEHPTGHDDPLERTISEGI
ncbi:MAG: hypothetical protein HQK51_12650, partial [Oligoflexia bacterium]|nr:hypothetical protein [Oligoflexia bacterium]